MQPGIPATHGDHRPEEGSIVDLAGGEAGVGGKEAGGEQGSKGREVRRAGDAGEAGKVSQEGRGGEPSNTH